MTKNIEPGYITLYQKGELQQREESAFEILKACSLCPRNCKVDRSRDERGFCKTGLRPIISSYGAHFGEESRAHNGKGNPESGSEDAGKYVVQVFHKGC